MLGDNYTYVISDVIAECTGMEGDVKWHLHGGRDVALNRHDGEVRGELLYIPLKSKLWDEDQWELPVTCDIFLVARPLGIWMQTHDKQEFLHIILCGGWNTHEFG